MPQELIDVSVNETRIDFDRAKTVFTCGACHVLAYEMLKLLPIGYKIGCLEDHCFIVEPTESMCYDIKGSHNAEDLVEQWASFGEEWFQTYMHDDMDEFIEIANEMYINDIIPNAVNDSLMDDAKHWAKKIVDDMWIKWL